MSGFAPLAHQGESLEGFDLCIHALSDAFFEIAHVHILHSDTAPIKRQVHDHASTKNISISQLNTWDDERNNKSHAICYKSMLGRKEIISNVAKEGNISITCMFGDFQGYLPTTSYM